MRAPHLFLLLPLAACIENSFKDGAANPSEEGDDTDTAGPVDTSGTVDRACPDWSMEPEEVGLTDQCVVSEGSFTPIIEWNLGEGLCSRSTVAVGDLDQDGMPEVVASITTLFGNGSLVVASGDGSGVQWQEDSAEIGYASGPVLGDLDGDGFTEIVVVREYANSMLGVGDYTVVAYDSLGDMLWESDHFVGDDFDYGTAVSISDMDHDGSPEVVAGRVILYADGDTRGVGAYGRGSIGQVAFGDLTLDEASVSAVADLDLDGVEEVIVGNAAYSPDGETLWVDGSVNDGMISIANLDDDPEGEFVAVTNNTVRVTDTDGTVIWGPTTIASANIVSPAAIDDLDGDGEPEIVVAGGNSLVVFNQDGSRLWGTAVTDMSGASGASIFDFEGDGQLEVVYIDEVEMAAYDGATGALKFYSTDHASDTMYDYPVIADVDADGQAEIVVAHVLWDYAISVYGDLDESWAPARQVWNQHAYSITNINDDLTVPTTATPNFTTYNSWHSAYDRESGAGLSLDLEGQLLDVCTLDCDQGVLRVAGRLLNKSPELLPAGVWVSLYAVEDGERVLADTAQTASDTPAGTSGELLEFEVNASLAARAESLWLEADDDGTGTGAVPECSEDNNGVTWSGDLCP